MDTFCKQLASLCISHTVMTEHCIQMDIQPIKNKLQVLYCTCMSSSLRLMRLLVSKFSSLFFSASSLIRVLNASLFSCVRRLISSFKLSTSCWSATDNWDIKSWQQEVANVCVSSDTAEKNNKHKCYISLKDHFLYFLSITFGPVYMMNTTNNIIKKLMFRDLKSGRITVRNTSGSSE